ncbi:MAG: hypothetical protein HEQ23_09360 [Tepidisphaera sp.]
MAHDTAKPIPSSPTTPARPTPPSPPTHEKLLIDLFEFNLNIQELIRFHDLTPAQFLAFSKDTTVRETLDAFEAFQAREQRILARQAQSSAAGHLNQSIMDAPNTIEARRAATALARLTTLMQPRPARSPRAGACRPAISSPARERDGEGAESSRPLASPARGGGGGGAESSRRRGSSTPPNQHTPAELPTPKLTIPLRPDLLATHP